MEDFIMAILIGAVAFFAGTVYGKVSLVRKLTETLTSQQFEKLIELLSGKSNQFVTPSAESIETILKQEVIDGNVYLFDSQDNFVCQGSSASEAAERYRSISTSSATVRCAHGSAYKIVSGKIERFDR